MQVWCQIKSTELSYIPDSHMQMGFFNIHTLVTSNVHIFDTFDGWTVLDSFEDNNQVELVSHFGPYKYSICGDIFCLGFWSMGNNTSTQVHLGIIKRCLKFVFN